MLGFRVPPRRVFPEREEPWVLARVLRRAGDAKDFVEAGTILDAAGLPFDGELSWTDEGREAGVALAYRVEFRNADRRRRSLSPPIELSWAAVPGAPQSLEAAGDEGAVRLSWEAPAGAAEGLRYAVYRREEAAAGEGEPIDPLPPGGRTFLDSRVQPGRRYCYRVRAVAAGTPVDVEGPAGEERCAATEDAVPPPAPTGLRVSEVAGAFQLAWDPVEAPDLLGYRVYRAAGGGSLGLVTPEPIPGTAWRDDPPPAERGITLRWAVTSVDRSSRRNESPFSAPAAIEPRK